MEDTPTKTTHTLTALDVVRLTNNLKRVAARINFKIIWDLYREKYKGVEIPSASLEEVRAKFRTDLIHAGAIE